MKTVLVTGIGDTRNNGCWAMAASAITSIRELSPVPVKFLILNRRGAIDHQRLPFADVEYVCRPWTAIAYPKVRLPWILFCAAVIMGLSYVQRLIPVRFPFRNYWRAFRGADLILDLSGDSISSDYGLLANLTVLLPLLTARNLGKPYYLCAQSIGPFSPGRLGRFVHKVVRSANLITTREELTRRLLAEEGIFVNVRRTQDLAFLLPPADEARQETMLSEEGIDRSGPWVGISVSSIIAGYAFRDLPREQREDAYLQSMADFADSLVERHAFRILFVPHVITPGSSDDRRVTHGVRNRMRRKAESHVIKGEYTGSELKALIGICRFFVGSRMHATVAALSQGIPTITLVYNHKTLGINGDILGQQDRLLDVRSTKSFQFAGRLYEYFVRMVEQSGEIQRGLESRLPSIRQGALQNAYLATDFLDVAGPLGNMSCPTLCTGCGTCVSACPVRALEMRETPQGTLRPGLRNGCSNCRRCDEVCPGLGLDLDEAMRIRFGNGAEDQDPEMGVVANCHTGHAADEKVRFRGASGGLVTAVATYLLASGRVESILVLDDAMDNPFRPRGRWATCGDEVIKTQGSRYQPAPLNEAIAEIPPNCRRFAVVGLPCHLWGLEKLERSGLIGDRKIEWRLGLFCGRTPSLHAVDTLLESAGATRDGVRSIAYRGNGWPGRSKITLADRDLQMPLSEMWGFIGSPFFTPDHCFACPDFFALLSDLSFGDAWLPERRHDTVGSSLVLARTGEAEALLLEMAREGRVHLAPVEPLNVKSAFRGNIRSKQQQAHALPANMRRSISVSWGKPGHRSEGFSAGYRWDRMLARMGRSQAMRRSLLRFPPGRLFRGMRRVSNRLKTR